MYLSSINHNSTQIRMNSKNVVIKNRLITCYYYSWCKWPSTLLWCHARKLASFLSLLFCLQLLALSPSVNMTLINCWKGRAQAPRIKLNAHNSPDRPPSATCKAFPPYWTIKTCRTEVTNKIEQNIGLSNTPLNTLPKIHEEVK